MRQKTAITILFGGLLLSGLVGLSACSGRNRALDQLAQEQSGSELLDSKLTFKDVTLEQVDEQGRLLWRVKAAQARYSKDQKVARIEKPTGELYQDGKLLFKITARRGEVQQDGKKIFLEEQIVSTDVRDGLTLQGDKLEWEPSGGILIVRGNLQGTHAQMDATAKEGRVISRERRMELLGNVVANTKDPALQLKTEYLVWQMAKQLVIGDRPIQMERFLNKEKTIADKANAEKAEVNLKTKVVTAKSKVQMALVQPPLDITGNTLVWNLDKQLVASEEPLKIVHREEKVTLTSEKGQLDLRGNVAYLTGNVQGNGEKDRSFLRSDLLTWKLPSQEVEAEGNVIYRRPDPPFNLAGPKAFGKLQGQTIVVSGGQVVTEIVP